MLEPRPVAAARYRSKTLATWLALLVGGFGLHRIYLHGFHDRWAWLLLPIGGLMLAQATLCAIVYGLTPDARWDARHNPGLPVRHTAWGPVLGAVAGLMIGATALLSTIAYSGQRYFESQVEAGPGLSR